MLVYLIFFQTAVFAQSDQNKKSDLEIQIQKLEEEAATLDANVKDTEAQANTLAGEIKAFNNEIKKSELEIRRLELAIRQAENDITRTSREISVLSAKLDRQRKALAASLFLLSTYENNSLLVVLLKNRTLSSFFTTLYDIGLVQKDIQTNVTDIRQDVSDLENKKNELLSFQQEQTDLKSLREVEKRFLAEKKKEKDDILRLTKGKEALFQQLLKLKKKNITELRTQLFYLEKTGLTAEDAVRLADLAAKRAGIRTAFLLALLEVETGKQFEDGVISVGTNVGTGNWQRDLYQCYINLGRRSAAESEKNAFFQITGKLNLDPDKMPVSRKPSYGCGGAMGAAQFLPTTWLRFEDRVADLTGHNPPSPWDSGDAFTAAAVFLADAGASSQTSIGEMRAAKTYISGSPSCTKYICRIYSSRIASLAQDIDKIL